MTLAAILLLTLSSVSQTLWQMPQLTSYVAMQSAPTQEKPAAADQNQTSETPSQNQAGSTTTPASAPAAKPSAKKPPTATRPHHKQSRPNPDCNPTPPAKGGSAANGAQGANTQSTNSGSATNAATPKTSSTASAPGKASASTNCPPPKIVIQQGGTTETNIQLVGGGASAAQASDARQNATQMLQSTEANLKKMEGTQLNSNQQEMIRQIHLFVDQSKAATTAGDLDRARTLAWKAQLLSEELVTPPK